MKEMAKTKDAQITEELLADLPDEYLACRDMRHAWQVSADFYVYEMLTSGRKIRLPKGSMVIARELTCMRCQTGRREIYVQRRWGLEKIRNSYSYDDAYRVNGIPRGITPSRVIHDVQYRKAMERLALRQKQQAS